MASTARPAQSTETPCPDRSSSGGECNQGTALRQRGPLLSASGCLLTLPQGTDVVRRRKPVNSVRAGRVLAPGDRGRLRDLNRSLRLVVPCGPQGWHALVRERTIWTQI